MIDCKFVWRSLLLALVSFGFAAAQVPMASYLGRELGYASAKTLSRGGVAALDAGPGALFTNPALLASARQTTIEGGYAIKVAAETRTRVVYDQFENTLGEVAIAENINSVGLPGPLTGVLRVGQLGLGIGIAAVRDFSYRYRKEYRDDFYVLTGEDRVEGTGLLYDAGLGFGVRPVPWFGFGARGGFGFGTRSLEVWSIRGPDTTLISETGRPRGFFYSGGLVVMPSGRLILAGDFSGSSSFKNWTEAEVATDHEYPWAARVGVSFRAPGTLPSTFVAEARYAAWKVVDSLFSNSLMIRAGVEHTMLNYVNLRYGFGVEPQYYDPTLQTLSAGFGLGFDAGVLRVDVGALFQHDVSEPEHFWQPLWESDVKVQSTRSRIAVTASRSF